MLDNRIICEIEKNTFFIMEHKNLFPIIKDLNFDDIFQLLISIEEEKQIRNELTDSLIDYDDEIIEIVELNEQDCMDITVTGDNLFYANGILTKNSIGLPAVADLFIAVSQTDELANSGKYLFKQLKNRMGDISTDTRFVIGVDKPLMKLYDVNQGDIMHDNKPDKKDLSKQKFLPDDEIVVNKSKFKEFK